MKSPSGSMFPYYYKGGEILGSHFGSFFADEEGVLAVMKAEEEFIAQPNRRLRVWVDFYETQLTDRVLTEFVASVHRLRTHLVKLAIVGCSLKDQWRLRRLSKKSSSGFPVPVKFFSDPEDAKTWLVGEF